MNESICIVVIYNVNTVVPGMRQREGQTVCSCISCTYCVHKVRMQFFRSVCLCTDLVLSLRAGTPFADAREALGVSQEQAAAKDSQRSC